MNYGSSYRSPMLADMPIGREMSDMVTRIADSDVGRAGQRIGTGLQSSLDSAVRERPLATLAAVAVVAFALGALWRS